jgi:hypothetical protein
MNFEPFNQNQGAMKNLVLVIAGTIFIMSCTASKEGSEAKLSKKLAEQEMVKKAVESRQYIIKLDKIYMQGGGAVDLIPRSNFFIINGEIASVSLAYLGRSYFSRPITGINFNGHTVKYKMVSDEAKGVYDIEVDVALGNDKFNFYLSIGTSGYCNISLNNPYIESVSYRGTLVPIKKQDNTNPEPPEKDLKYRISYLNLLIYW